MAFSLEQLQSATLDDIKQNRALANELGSFYHGFKDGQLAQPNNPSIVGDWLSGSRDFNYDKQYALRNAAGGDRSNPVTAQFYGDGKFAPKDVPAFYAPPPKPEAMGSTFNAGQLGYGTTPTPQLPAQTAGTNTIAYANSIAGDVANRKATLEQTYKSQIDQLQKQIDASNTKIAEYTTLQKNQILPDIEAQLKPFREDLEKKERERLKVEENYFENQKLTGELESLLTTLQEQIKAEEAVTGLGSIRSPRIAKIKDEVAGRVGVIEAVMSARSGQIAEAYRLIDRSVDAISADRQDRLKYYETLFNFYENEKDSAGKRLISLEDDKKQFIGAQVAQIQNDLQEAQATANYIKELMVDPKTALTAAQAGITLNDTIDTVNQKLSKQIQVEERSALINDMSAKGYSYAATPAQLVGKKPEEIFTVLDSRGNPLKFIKPTGANGSMDGLLTDAQIQTTVNGIVNQFDNEPVVKEYNVIASGYQFAQSLVNQTTPTSADDQGLLYAFAKAMDPNSVVREGEYATVQKYAQSAIQRGWANAKRFASNEAFLSEEARKNMLATINSKFQSANQAYQNVYSEYNRRIDEAKGGKITGSITNYGAAFGGSTGTTPTGGGSVSFDSWASF